MTRAKKITFILGLLVLVAVLLISFLYILVSREGKPLKAATKVMYTQMIKSHWSVKAITACATPELKNNILNDKWAQQKISNLRNLGAMKRYIGMTAFKISSRRETSDAD